MLNTNNNQNKIDTVFVLMIFCVFAISVFLVLMLSANTYRTMMDISQDGQDQRIALSYVRTKIRSTDAMGNINIINFHGVTALAVEEEIGDRRFVTYIYSYHGYIREIFMEVGQNFLPRDGMRMIRSDDIYFRWVNDILIEISTPNYSLLVYPRSQISTEGGLNFERTL